MAVWKCSDSIRGKGFALGLLIESVHNVFSIQPSNSCVFK